MKHLIFTICVAVGLVTASTGLSSLAQAATITVNASGGADHLTITEAVAAAQAGDTILVSPGLYSETLIVDQAVSLVSTGGSGVTILSGPENNEDVLTITAAGVNLDGFSITSGQIGLVISDTAEAITINDVVIEETGRQQVSIAANLVTWALPQVNLVAHASGQYDGVRVTSGTIEQSTTWPVPPAGFVYYLESTVVTVSGPSGPVLSIPDGLIIKKFFSRFEIGTATQPGGLMANNVTFTSSYDDIGGDTNGTNSSPIPGNWQRIDFNASARSDSSRVTNCTLRYGGGSNGTIEISGSDPLIQGNTFSDNRTDLYVQQSLSLGLNQTGNTLNQGDGLPVVTNVDHLDNLVFGNTIVPRGDDRWNGIGILDSQVTSSYTLPVLPHNFVYYLNGCEVTVAGPQGPVLTIPDGTVIKMFFSRFDVGSTSQPGGLVANNVTFTSIYDDIGGDTNGTASSPGPGNWQRVDFNATARSDSSRVTNCTLSYGGGSSGALEVNSSDPLIQGNTFSNNRVDLYVQQSLSLGLNQTGNTLNQGDGLPVITNLDDLDHLVSGNTIVPRGDDRWNGIGILDSEVTSSYTLPVLPHDFVYYLVNCEVTVAGSQGPVLTIPDGTVIKMFFSRFDVGSATQPGGLMANNVIFTSIYDDIGGDTNGTTSSPGPANWQRIAFHAAARTDSSRVTGSTLSYGGGGTGAIEVNSSDPLIQGNTFSNNRVDLQVQQSPTLGLNQTGNTLNQGDGLPVVTNVDHLDNLVFGNTIVPRGDDRWNGIGILDSEVTSSYTLPVLPHDFVYYLVNCEIIVAGPQGPVLTIPDGTVIKMFFSRFDIGSATEPGGLMASNVIFTSTNDDFAGDTNGTNSNPNPGNWQSLNFGPNALTTSRLEDCEIRYGGNPAIDANGSRPALRNCLIENSSGTAVRTRNTGANPSLVLCTLTNNGGGILAENGGSAIVVRCCFEGNDDFGVQAPAIAGPAGSFMAEDCWWGAVDGPGGDGPGSGDAVFGDVVFTPWYTTEACNDLSPAPDQEANLPTQVTVYGAAPNPFNPSTRIAFALPSDMPVALKIYGLDGSLVKTLVQDNLAAGRHEVRWDGQDNRGRTVAAGVYFYRLVAGDRQVVDKLMLIK